MQAIQSVLVVHVLQLSKQAIHVLSITLFVLGQSYTETNNTSELGVYPSAQVLHADLLGVNSGELHSLQ